MKIAILGAMQEEINPLLQSLDTTKKEYANNSFYFAKYKNHELIIAYSKIGKVNSAITTSALIEKFGTDILLFTGVAGALSENLKIGNIICATKLAQHDIDLSIFGHPYGYLPESKLFYKSDEKLNLVATRVAKKIGIDLKFGIIVSGDQFICDNEKKLWIKKEFNADAVEMEGASVAQACTVFNTPFLILRSISDEADSKAEVDFEKFVEDSAKISANFVLNIIEEL